MSNHIKWAFLCSFLLVGPTVGVGVGETDPAHSSAHHNAPQGPSTISTTTTTTSSTTTPEARHHTLRKRFIWTLTQEPYFYGKDEGRSLGGGGSVGGSEALPEALPLRRDAPLHKRLYPRWYQAYMYKTPSFNHVASPMVGEHKRFQPFHPLARFRGLSLGGSSPSSSYRVSYDLPFVDNSGHRLPTAPNAQPSFKYDTTPMLDEEEDEEEAEELNLGDEGPVKAGDLLVMLKDIARLRGMSGHTKRIPLRHQQEEVKRR